jgi:PAS domain S-box-containing protein
MTRRTSTVTAPWMDVVHPEDRERGRHILASRESGKNFELTYRIRHKDGRMMNVLQRGTFTIGPRGRPSALRLVEDITETERQRNQLHGRSTSSSA